MRSFLTGVLCATAMLTSVSAQTLTIGVRGGPDSIDPHFTATGSHAESLKHVFDTLVWSGRPSTTRLGSSSYARV